MTALTTPPSPMATPRIMSDSVHNALPSATSSSATVTPVKVQQHGKEDEERKSPIKPSSQDSPSKEEKSAEEKSPKHDRLDASLLSSSPDNTLDIDKAFKIELDSSSETVSQVNKKTTSTSVQKTTSSVLTSTSSVDKTNSSLLTSMSAVDECTSSLLKSISTVQESTTSVEENSTTVEKSSKSTEKSLESTENTSKSVKKSSTTVEEVKPSTEKRTSSRANTTSSIAARAALIAPKAGLAGQPKPQRLNSNENAVDSTEDTAPLCPAANKPKCPASDMDSKRLNELNFADWLNDNIEKGQQETAAKAAAALSASSSSASSTTAQHTTIRVCEAEEEQEEGHKDDDDEGEVARLNSDARTSQRRLSGAKALHEMHGDSKYPDAARHKRNNNNNNNNNTTSSSSSTTSSDITPQSHSVAQRLEAMRTRKDLSPPPTKTSNTTVFSRVNGGTHGVNGGVGGNRNRNTNNSLPASKTPANAATGNNDSSEQQTSFRLAVNHAIIT